MVTRPNYIVMKGAQRVQGIFVLIGVFFGLAAFGNFSAGDVGGGLTCAAICAGAILIASKIKTKKKWVASQDIYR